MNTSSLIDLIRTTNQPMDPVPTEVTPVLVSLPAIRCVLFDMYGTLFISSSGDIGTASDSSGFAKNLSDKIAQSHQQSRESGIEWPEIDIRTIWASVLKDRGEQPDQAYIEQRAVEHECRINPVWPMPGALEVIRALHERKLRLGLVSNAQFFTPLLFPALLQSTHTELGFPESRCVWSYRLLEAKPSLRLFQEVLKTLEGEGILPDEVLYVGNDMRNDIRPATRCGCRTALFAGDKRSLRLREDDPGMEQIEPDLVLTDLRQLLTPGIIA